MRFFSLFFLLPLLLLGSPPPGAPQGTTVSAQAFSLVDASGAEHLSIWHTLYTHEVVLTADNPTVPDGIELTTLNGGTVDVGYDTGLVRMSAPHGVDVYGGVPLVVEGGPNSTVSAASYTAAGKAGLTATIPLCTGGTLRIIGGLVVDYTP